MQVEIMANTLRIKRRLTGASAAPGALSNAELAFNEVNNTLHVRQRQRRRHGHEHHRHRRRRHVCREDRTSIMLASAATPAGVAYLDQNNSYGASYTNTFNGTVNLEGTFKIDNVTVNTSADELNVLDGVTAGTASAG
jgi:hypothetical protein